MNTDHIAFALMMAGGAVILLRSAGRSFVTGHWPSGTGYRRVAEGRFRDHAAWTMWVLSWGVAFSIFTVADLVRGIASLYLWCVGTALLLSGWTLAIIRNQYVRKNALPAAVHPTAGQSSLNVPGGP